MGACCNSKNIEPSTQLIIAEVPEVQAKESRKEEHPIELKVNHNPTSDFATPINEMPEITNPDSKITLKNIGTFDFSKFDYTED